MNYRPPSSYHLGECWALYWDGLYHLFHLQGTATGWGGLGHAISQDFVYWTTQDTIKIEEVPNSFKAFSPIIPQNIKDSSLPVGFFEVHLKNPSSGRKSVSIAFSWEDLPGRQIYNVKDKRLYGESVHAVDAYTTLFTKLAC